MNWWILSLHELMDFCFANLALALAVDQHNLLADELDNDHGMVVPPESSVHQQMTEKAKEDV